MRWDFSGSLAVLRWRFNRLKLGEIDGAGRQSAGRCRPGWACAKVSDDLYDDGAPSDGVRRFRLGFGVSGACDLTG